MSDDKSTIEKLRDLQCFYSLDYSELLNIVRYSSLRTYRKDRVICYQDDIADTVFFIVSGRIRKEIWRADSNSIIIGTAESEEWIGLPEVISDAVYLADCITEEESEILSLHKNSFKLIMNIPPLQELIIKELARGYYPLYSQMQIYTPYQKIINFLKNSLDSNEDDLSNNTSINITQENIAEIIGLTRVTVGKYLKKLQEQKVISLLRGKIKIIDVKKLNEIDI